jgi:chromate transporter
MRADLLWTLFIIFVPMSLLAVGGGASILAPIHHQMVEVHGWLTQREFIDVFAISRAAPGPGSIMVTLIGWKIAGWPGAIAASLGIFAPSSVLCFGVAKAWNRSRGSRFHTALEQGLVPLAAGLMIAGAIAILRASDTGPLGWAVAAASTSVMMWRSVHPLLVLSAGGILYTAVALALGVS